MVILGTKEQSGGKVIIKERSWGKVHFISILMDCWFYFVGLFLVSFQYNSIFEYYDSEQNINHVRQRSLNICITFNGM